MNETNRVLIIEDDKEIASVVAMNIEDLGLGAEHAFDGKKGWDMARQGEYDLIILDLMLPLLDGISVCTKIRESDSYTPILILTARAEEIDRVMGLELGADDYMTKPFSVRELQARVKALLRRAKRGSPSDIEQSGEDQDIIRVGELEIDFTKHRVTRNNRALDLTVKEFELLTLFASNPGRAYSRENLLNLVWGYQFKGYEHTVNTHINRLRNKIEQDPARPRYLETVWGIGYRFAETSEVKL